jgi:hypothetical protein
MQPVVLDHRSNSVPERAVRRNTPPPQSPPRTDTTTRDIVARRRPSPALRAQSLLTQSLRHLKRVPSTKTLAAGYSTTDRRQALSDKVIKTSSSCATLACVGWPLAIYRVHFVRLGVNLRLGSRPASQTRRRRQLPNEQHTPPIERYAPAKGTPRPEPFSALAWLSPTSTPLIDMLSGLLNGRHSK